jgi:hypothetical protein
MKKCGDNNHLGHKSSEYKKTVEEMGSDPKSQVSSKPFGGLCFPM